MKRRDFISKTTMAGISGILVHGCSSPGKMSNLTSKTLSAESPKKHSETVSKDIKNKGDNMKLVVATCQFPVSDSIEDNCNHIIQQMKLAKKKGLKKAF